MIIRTTFANTLRAVEWARSFTLDPSPLRTDGDFGQDEGQGECGLGANRFSIIVRPDGSATASCDVSVYAEAFSFIGDAIVNGTAQVADTGPEITIDGINRDGKRFSIACHPSGALQFHDYDELTEEYVERVAD